MPSIKRIIQREIRILWKIYETKFWFKWFNHGTLQRLIRKQARAEVMGEKTRFIYRLLKAIG